MNNINNTIIINIIWTIQKIHATNHTTVTWIASADALTNAYIILTTTDGRSKFPDTKNKALDFINDCLLRMMGILSMQRWVVYCDICSVSYFVHIYIICKHVVYKQLIIELFIFYYFNVYCWCIFTDMYWFILLVLSVSISFIASCHYEPIANFCNRNSSHTEISYLLLII